MYIHILNYTKYKQTHKTHNATTNATSNEIDNKSAPPPLAALPAPNVASREVGNVMLVSAIASP